MSTPSEESEIMWCFVGYHIDLAVQLGYINPGLFKLTDEDRETGRRLVQTEFSPPMEKISAMINSIKQVFGITWANIDRPPPPIHVLVDQLAKLGETEHILRTPTTN